jgi:hypothetical protein
MPTLHRQARSIALLGMACLLLGACKQPREVPPTVEDLMQDRVALDGILLKCSQGKSVPGADCEIARVAAERLGAEKEATEVARRQQDFERNREKLRLNDDQRKAAQTEKKVDVYTMPVVPVEPPPASTANPP